MFEITGIKKLRSVLNNNVKDEEVYICGSAILSAKDIRMNNDLEFFIYPKKNRECVIWKQKELIDGIELFDNFYAFCGFSDKMIVENNLFTNYQKFRIVNLELEFLYKQELVKLMNRDKDHMDLELIQQYDPTINEKAKKLKSTLSSSRIRVFSQLFFRALLIRKRIILKFTRRKNEDEE